MTNLNPNQVAKLLNQVAKLLPELLRSVPAKVRGWVYLALVVAAVAFIGVTAWRDGLSSDQLVALALAVAGGMAHANRDQG